MSNILIQDEIVNLSLENKHFRLRSYGQHQPFKQSQISGKNSLNGINKIRIDTRIETKEQISPVYGG